MAKMNILINGLSGTGKTSVGEELVKRGYLAIDADASFAFLESSSYYDESGRRVPEAWNWNREKLTGLLSDQDESLLFICGGATNESAFYGSFDKIITLTIRSEVMERRLLNRAVNNYASRRDELRQQIKWNQTATDRAQQYGALIIDAEIPLDQVVNRVIGAATMDIP